MKALLLLFLFLSLSITAGQSNSVANISAERWCPYTCNLEQDGHEGLIVEVISKALKLEGFEINYNSDVSYTRAVQNIIDGTSDIFLSADDEHTEIMNFSRVFHVVDETAFVVLKDKPIHLEKPSDLFNYNIAVLSEYIYDDEDSWEDHIESHPSKLTISVVKGEPHLLTLIQRERIDIAIMNRDVANLSIKFQNLENEIDIIRKNVTYNLHLGFAKTARGERFKKIFEAGFQKLLHNNQLKPIYKKYDIEIPDFKKK